MARVVIADDSVTMRRIVTTVLSREGHEVVAAENGVQAVQAVFEHQPDAVVLDVHMPRLSGYVAARLLKDDWQTADIPVVLLTTLDAPGDRFWGLQTGADRYLTKDFEAPDLVAAVNEVLANALTDRGGRARLAPPPSMLSDDDVLYRVCELLDRKLFESTVGSEVLAVASRCRGLADTAGDLLDVLRGFVNYDLASVVLRDESIGFLAVGGPVTVPHRDEFLSAAADALAAATNEPVDRLETRITVGDDLVGDDRADGGMATFLSMPLRGHGGRVIGVLALSSAAKAAFGEVALATLRLIDGPAALVVDTARHAGLTTG